MKQIKDYTYFATSFEYDYWMNEKFIDQKCTEGLQEIQGAFKERAPYLSIS